MKYTIFFSWASDLPNASNRTLIQDALNDAIKAINQDKEVQLEVCLERDTLGVPGSPPIAETIFSKIQNSNLFVCDVSIINQGKESRKTPNPNVLIELGFAARHLSWDDIVCVCNTDFGPVEDLPFDIRHRRITSYNLNGKENKQNVKAELTRLLSKIIKSRMEHHDKYSQIVDVNFFDRETKSSLGKDIEARCDLTEPITREEFIRTASLESIGVTRQDNQNKLIQMSYRRFEGDSWKEYLASMILDREKLQASPGKAIVRSVSPFENDKYFDSMIEYISKNNCIIPISVCISGIGHSTLKQVHVELHWKHDDNVKIYNIDSVPRKPEKSVVSKLLGRRNTSQITIESMADGSVVNYHFDTIHPGQTVVAEEDIFVCPTTSNTTPIEVRVFSDNNPPATLPLNISFTVEKKRLDLMEMANFED